MKSIDAKTTERILNVCNIVCSGIIIILVVLQIAGIWKNAVYVFEPLLGVKLLIQAFQNCEQNKPLALFSIVAAIIIFVAALVILIL